MICYSYSRLSISTALCGYSSNPAIGSETPINCCSPSGQKRARALSCVCPWGFATLYRWFYKSATITRAVPDQWPSTRHKGP